MPTQKVLRVPLTELERVSVTCLKCSGSFELNVGDILQRFRDHACPFCNEILFFGEPRSHRIFQLAGVIEDLRKDKKVVDVRLVLPLEAENTSSEG